jgi:sporulation protein YlmC with PRC-barrel domain
MRRVLSTLLCAGLTLAGPVNAQQPNTGSDGSHGSNGDSARRTHQLYRSSKIVGSPVHDPKDKKIGEIKDLMLDSARGEIAYAVVNFGGVLGVGAKYHAVPWQALEPSDDGRYYVLYADRETITQAPGFDRSRWPDMADQRWSADIDRYWSRMVGRGPANGNRLSTDAAGSGGAAGRAGEQSSGSGGGHNSSHSSSGK